MSVMSRPAMSSGAPFRLRRRHSFTRSSIRITRPERALYCGKLANVPTHELEEARVPALEWQLVHASRLPTCSGSESRVASTIARPRRIEAPSGPEGMSESAGTAKPLGAATESGSAPALEGGREAGFAHPAAHTSSAPATHAGVVAVARRNRTRLTCGGGRGDA